MADFLGIDLNKFEDQIINFIEVYYSILNKGEKLASLKENGGIKWKEQIIKYLDYYCKEDSPRGVKSRIETIKEFLDEATKKNRVNVEFYMVLDICQFLYEIYFDENHDRRQRKSNEHIKKHMSRCIYKELIFLRNKLSHNENPPFEYVLRFYEDQYYLIKFMKPEKGIVELSEYTIKNIKLNIHLFLEKNLNYKNSFDLNPLQEEFIQIEREKLNEKNDRMLNKNFSSINKSREAIKSMFQFTPFKLPKYNFMNNIEDKNFHNNSSIMNNSKVNEEDDNEKEIYERSAGNSSHNSISDVGSISSSQSSEKGSINENNRKPGNVKEGDESNSYITKTDIQEDI